MPDADQIGQDRTFKDAVEADKAANGTYEDKVTSVEPEQRLPTTQMPKAPDPSPFTLGGGG